LTFAGGGIAEFGIILFHTLEETAMLTLVCTTKYCSIRCKVLISNFIFGNGDDVTGGG
jgi:hypothetical protein